MIIIGLKGGLGNQLFQYAFGKSLALKNNVELKLDSITGYLNDDHGRQFCLNHFNIKAEYLTRNEIEKIDYVRYSVLIQKFLDKKKYSKKYFLWLLGKISRKCILIQERSLAFDDFARKFRSNRNIYYDGYWQNEKYFYDIKNILLNELQVVHPLEGRNLELSQKMGEGNSVSLHIRRGDNVSHPGSIKTFKVPPKRYYYEAVKYLTRHMTKIQLFIFSDDLSWVKQNLKFFQSTTYVDINNGNTDYEDLRLMSLCKYNIISNSTFSWWGAWLNQNPNKIVISPEKWFNASSMNADAKDLIPKNWIKI